MKLAEELERIRADFEQRGDPRYVEAYRVGIAQLLASALVADSVAVGQPMPSFLLPNVEGRLVDSAELLARGPLVVSFFRGEWCRFCRPALAALREAAPAIAAAGASLVAITPDTGEAATDAKRKLALPFDILSDADGGVGLAFGILFRLPEAILDVFQADGPDLPLRHGNEAWTLPVPATYVVDRDGIVRFRFVDPDFRRRAEPDDILTALRSLPAGRTGSAPASGG
ncbi:MAG: AhpC/TSA family protein [Alphaproteobacteria bacterium]|nr:AhpC/TSA family protein [Alphaproteobacteria bacterium]